jgi:outer membrane protein OmpA-like peptidoglycan-associated protein
VDVYLADLLFAPRHSRDRFATAGAAAPRVATSIKRDDVRNLMWPRFPAQKTQKNLRQLSFSSPVSVPRRLSDLGHIRRIEPALPSEHPNVIRRNNEDATMTSLLRLSGLTAITLTAALSMTAGLAIAGDNNVSADQIVNALQPKPVTRGLSAGPQVDPAVKDKEISFIQTLRNRKTRSLSLGEREEVAQIASTKPNIDLDIQFDYNSADIRKTSMPAAQELGKALSNASLKGSTFVVAGHTDAIGGEAYNQDLSERRADTIKRFLVDKYGINGTDLVTVGYGKDKPKDPNAPMDPINRRVQVVNMDTKTASR